jgi:hypothetical protein
MTNFRCTAAALLLALTVAGASNAATAQENCVSGREGTKLVKSRQVMPFPAAAQRAGISPRDVQGVALCGTDGRFVYRVVVVQKSGAPRSVTIPAN